MFDHCLMGFHPSIATPSVLFVVWLGSGKQCILGVAEPACRGHIYIVIVYYGNICKITNVWFYAWYIWEISVIENQQNLWVVFFQSFQEQKFHGVQGDSKPPQQMTQTFAAFQGTIDPWFKSNQPSRFNAEIFLWVGRHRGLRMTKSPKKTRTHSAVMDNWWFGARWFGFLGSPYENW